MHHGEVFSRVEPLAGGAPARGSPAGGGSGGGEGQRQRMALPRRRLAWLWVFLLVLLAPHPARCRELTPSLLLAPPDARVAPARRLRQVCQLWPLSFRNENCSSPAAITVRAQLGAPIAPGSQPCLNGASQSGEWCVRAFQLGAGQQQLAFPQVLSNTFQWYAEVKLPSSQARWWGGNSTSPQTPWFDVASGQPCGPPPDGNATSIVGCRPFREVNAAQIEGGCVDPATVQPVVLLCDELNTTCSTRLLVANNCSLNINALVYGVLAENVLPGFCINNSTRPGEACLKNAFTYISGTASTATNYAFQGQFSAGMYMYAWVPQTNISWNGTDPDSVLVDYTTGERCPGPANATCLPFFQVAMDSSACGSTATQTFVCPGATCAIPHCATPSQFNGGCFCTGCEPGYFLGAGCQTLTDLLQGDPGCKDIPFDMLNATLGDPSCASWVTGPYAREPCPAACEFEALPEECLNSVAVLMIVMSKGLIPVNSTLPPFADAVLQACSAEEPVGLDAVAAIAQEALRPYASCGPDAPAAVARSSCQLLTKPVTSILSANTSDCDLECYTLLKSISLECYADFVAGTAVSRGLAKSVDAATFSKGVQALMGNAMAACERQAPAPSPAPPSPPAPDQPGTNTTSSGNSVPVAAIVGPLVGVAAAVAACAAIALALRRRRRQQRASSAGKAVDEFMYSPDGLGGSKATSSQEVSLASSGSAGMPAALASDPMVSWIMASQQGSRTCQRSGTSAARSQGSGGGSQMQAWEKSWSELKLQRVVGSGSYGQVYLAHWGTIPVAVKVLLVPGTAGANLAAPGAAQEALELALPPSALAQLEAEAGLLASLRHPCCVNFFGLTRNPPALVTEYCSRGSVAELLDRARAEPAVAAELTWRRRLGMLLDAAQGMVYLHSHKPSPIIHRDFKSPNLLVDEGWRTKVTDFGLSRAMEDTCSSVAVTNPRWLAPELMRGEHSTQASDVFAFGVVMWELLTWVRPWATTRVVAVPASTDEDTCQGGAASANPPKEFNPWQISSAVLAGRRLEVPDPAELPGPAPSSPAAFAAYVRLMQHCWAQAPGDRPSFPEVVQTLRSMQEEEAPASSADKS